jgi:hypothetical protein
MLLFGGISALKRSGRGFVWSATACALLALSAGVYFARYFSLLRDPMEYKWYLLIVIFVLLAAAALGVLNVAAYRKSAPGQTKRLGQIALAVPILLLLFLLFGWYRVGTFLMLRNLTEKGGDYVEIYNGKVSSDVIEYKEDWGETELEHHKVGGYIVTVPKGYFGTVESSSSEPDWDGYLHTPRLHTVSMCNDDLTVALFDVPDENEPGEFSILGIFLTPDFPVDLFDGTADPFECHKMVLNTVPADFSLFSTHNDCLKLLVRLETKPLIGTTGSGCFRQEIKTEHLRGLHGRMIKPFVAELFDSQGRQMTLYVWSAEEELTPEHQRIIKNFIASIRPVKN